MNIAVILSAGVGSRMKNLLPKQFIEVNNNNCNVILVIILVIVIIL